MSTAVCVNLCTLSDSHLVVPFFPVEVVITIICKIMISEACVVLIV